jgi:hypothetical protein
MKPDDGVPCRPRLPTLFGLRVVLCLMVALGFAGCADPILESIEQIKNGVCNCVDKRCADQWLTKMPTTVATSSRAKAEALGREMLDCYAKLQTEPPTDAGSAAQ